MPFFIMEQADSNAIVLRVAATATTGSVTVAAIVLAVTERFLIDPYIFESNP